MIPLVYSQDTKVRGQMLADGVPIFERTKQAVQNDEGRTMAVTVKMQLHEEINLKAFLQSPDIQIT